MTAAPAQPTGFVKAFVELFFFFSFFSNFFLGTLSKADCSALDHGCVWCSMD